MFTDKQAFEWGQPQRNRATERPTVARYALTSGRHPPSMTQALTIGELVHDALCRWSDQGEGPASVFSGFDSNGKPRMDHGHAHIFCEANGAGDVITHVTVWAPIGFDELGHLALRSLHRIWGRDGHRIGLNLDAIGRPEDFRDCVLFGPARLWRSATPFVSTRSSRTFSDGRPKLDPDGWQLGSPGHDLLRLLRARPNGQGAIIRQLRERERPLRFGRRTLSPLQFQTQRHNGEGTRGNSDGTAFVIAFPEEREGPFALGYAAHFGLGLFVPAPPLHFRSGWPESTDLAPDGG
jgi:CRISPR-associated protein Csb2